MEYDMVFFHAGGFNPEGLQGPYFPIGVIGLASLLDQNGFHVKIVNLLLEKILQPGLDTYSCIRAYPARVYGIDLHWFVHAYESITLAQIIKKEMPDSKIIIGGLTASLYDTEILEHFKCIDAAIRGDAELPLLQYVQYVLNKPDTHIETIPNLTYRDDSRNIVSNPRTYSISPKELDKTDFMRFDLALNWEKGLNLLNMDYVPIKEIRRSKGIDDYYQEDLPLKAYVLYTGRGCPQRCSFCGGSCTAFQKAFGRKMILRSPECIAEDVMRFRQLPVDVLYIPHSPLITSPAFHHRLLDEIENQLTVQFGDESKNRLPLGFIFEDCPFIIDFDIIERYMHLFDHKKSIFRLYFADVETNVSRLNRFPVDLDRILDLIEFLNGKSYCILGAMIGLPGQTRENTLKMAEFLQEAKRHNAQVLIYNAELHPGSELMQRPGHYNVSLDLCTFMDYYAFLRNKKDKGMTYGYNTSNDIGIEEQREILEDTLINFSLL